MHKTTILCQLGLFFVTSLLTHISINSQPFLVGIVSWYKIKKQKQNSIALAKQIKSETMQCSRQEKTAMESTTKKLMLQFGFVADPTLSTCHNALNTLATTPTWYYFSRPSNLAFHDFTKKHKPKKFTVTVGTWIKILFNTKFD